MSHSKETLSNDKISTGYADKLNSSCIIFCLNPGLFSILSSRAKGIWLPITFDENSALEPRVEKFGFIVNGWIASVKYPTSVIIPLN